jgi:hypothetical protein
MINRFGGVTSFSRAPAVGTFRDGAKVVQDEILVLEVMTEELDHEWWKTFRTSVERTFDQKEILIWAFPVTKL